MTFLLYSVVMFGVLGLVALVWREGYRTGFSLGRAASRGASDTNTTEEP